MTQLAIHAHSVSKQYVIQSTQRQVMLRDQIQRSVTSAYKSLAKSARKSRRASRSETIWALDQVSFDVEHGESLGIIGSNGAGKTTLLKVLSRITAPTEGRIRLRGRVGSLLEVGTGFHSELTGRENVFLNGAVLGMRRSEIEQKFDEIVDFSGVEDFIDTPVKRYSSGMRMRLAFSVAAHLEPEILLIDEVLAVGDIAFQQKSLTKMESVARAGRTVLFVSHNLAAVKAFCPRSIYLESGQLKFDGSTDSAVQQYIERTTAGGDVRMVEIDPKKPAQILSITTCTADGSPVGSFGHDEPLFLNIVARLNRPMYKSHVMFRVYNSNFDTILASRDFETSGQFLLPEEPGTYHLQARIPENLLVPGSYFIGGAVFAAINGNRVRELDRLDHAAEFDVTDNGSIFARNNLPWQGLLRADIDWSRQ